MSCKLFRLFPLACTVAAITVFSHSAGAQGGLVVEAPIVTAGAGSTGAFDVVLRNINAAGGASYDINYFGTGLSIDPVSGVTFTSISLNTDAMTAPYIFQDSAAAHGSPFTGSTFPSTNFGVYDSENNMGDFRQLNPGDVFGLVHVSYTVDASAQPGVDTLYLNGETTLFDENGNFVPTSLQNGSLTVTSAATTPEPGPLALIAGAGLFSAGFLARRKRSRRAV